MPSIRPQQVLAMARMKATLLSSAALICGALPATHLAAQTTSKSDATTRTDKAADRPEIVVTAERRESTVQKTPLSITALTGQQLQAAGIVSVSQLGYEVPGVSERNAGPGQTEYEMRGISSSGGSTPTVGFYLDDVPLTAPVQGLQGKTVIDPNLYDLNRVEVLRGPQGTLYGSSSMGGTIRLISNQPNLSEAGASIQVGGAVTQSGGPGGDINVMANIPLVTDKLALRVVGTESYVGGWIDRIVESPFPLESNGGFTRGNVLNAPVTADYKDVNWVHTQGVRGTLEWQPVDNLTISPTIFYQTIKQGSPSFVDMPPGVSYEAHYQPYDISEPYGDTFTLLTLPITYKFDNMSLTSVSGYYVRHSSLTQDASEAGQDFLEALIGIPNVSYAEAGPLLAYETDQTRQFTQEVRLASSGSGPLQWVVGAFYQNFEANSIIGTTTPGAIVDQIFGAQSYFYLAFHNTLQQYAGFGEASYRWGKFKFTAGLRYYDFKTDQVALESGGLIVGPGAPVVNSVPASSTGVNPKFNLDYEPSRDLTLYAQATKGFRPGGANGPPPQICPKFNLVYQPDSIWSYESGVKARLFGSRLTINAAGYYEDWAGIQQGVTLACGDAITANAGSAHVAGGEVESNIRITSDLTFSTGVGFTHATLASVPPGYSGFTTGERVQDVPDWTATATLVYKRRISDKLDLTLRGTDQYIGVMVDPSFQINDLPARQLLNMSATFIYEKKTPVTFYINNITDKRAWIDDPEMTFSFVPSLNRAVTNQPRTFGVKVSYAFGEAK